MVFLFVERFLYFSDPVYLEKFMGLPKDGMIINTGSSKRDLGLESVPVQSRNHS